MSLVNPDMVAPASALPLDFDFLPPPPPPAPTPQPPIGVPIGDGSIYGEFAVVFSSILAQMKTGDAILKRAVRSRTQPWRKQIDASLALWELVAYVSGPMRERKMRNTSIEFKLIVSAPHLGTTIEKNDTIMIDDVEYPVLDVKRVPRAGPVVMFWSVIAGFRSS